MDPTESTSNDQQNPESGSSTDISLSKLSDAQKSRIEKNRQKALLLKKSRLASRPYPTSKPRTKYEGHVLLNGVKSQYFFGGVGGFNVN